MTLSHKMSNVGRPAATESGFSLGEREATRKGGGGMKFKILLISAFSVLFFIFCFQPAYAWEPTYDCRSQGLWKNHPEDWPVDCLWIGGIKYCKLEAIAIMNTPTKGNKWITMFKQLVAAKLNQESGCICMNALSCIDGADDWMETANADFGNYVPASSKFWEFYGEDLYDCLDDFNNGILCKDGCD